MVRVFTVNDPSDHIFVSFPCAYFEKPSGFVRAANVSLALLLFQ